MIKFGAVMPHPPLLAPQVGGVRIKECERTQKACREIAKKIKLLDIDAIIMISPHGATLGSTVPIYASPVFEGDFSNFGASKPAYYFKGDPELASCIIRENPSMASRQPETILDHGSLVPLLFISEAGIKKPILPTAIAYLPGKKLFEFGKSLAHAAEKLKRKIAIIASADLSHRLTTDAPSGFDPSGKVFDEKLVDLMRRYDISGIINFDDALAESAGQDALQSISILLGAFDGIKAKAEVLSYEGPFGVGYMVAEIAPIS